MPQPTKQGNAKAQSWKPVVLVAVIAATLGFYFVSRDTDESATEFDAPAVEAAESADPVCQRDLDSIREPDGAGDVVSSMLRSSTPRSSAVADADTAQNSPSNLIPDSMVDDVILLQAQQQIELEQMQE